MPINEMDRWDGKTCGRVMTLGQTAALVEVEQVGSPERPLLRVTVGGRSSETRRSAVKASLVRALGIDIDLTPFYQIAGRDRRLTAHAHNMPVAEWYSA